MLKLFILFSVSILLLVSCENNNKQQVQLQQIDSMVNVKVQQHSAENAAKNDSILKAVELEKADAITMQQIEARKANKNINTADSAHSK